jgi:hypothetical protein
MIYMFFDPIGDIGENQLFWGPKVAPGYLMLPLTIGNYYFAFLASCVH